MMKRREFLNKMLAATIGGTAIIGASTASAQIGRPMTPMSVAGVRRRTRRRTRRRWMVMTAGTRVYSLPYGCPYTMYGGYYNCNGIYYSPVQQGGTVVYVVDHMDPGADPNVQIEEEY